MASKPFYESDKLKSGIIPEIQAIYRYRLLLSLMIKNNFITRYKRSVLGVLWTVLNPLLLMLVMSMAFSLLFGKNPGYPVYVLSGMILWNFFLQTTIATSNSLMWGGGLMKRIYFPRSTFVVANTGSGIINLFINLVPLLVIMLLTGVALKIALFFLPIAIFLTSLFVLGVSFFLAAITVFFPDTVDLYQALMRAAFYLTPVMYPENILPDNIAKYIQLNPMYSYITIFRYPIYEGKLPPSESILIALVFSIAAFILGSWFFARKTNQIAYLI